MWPQNKAFSSKLHTLQLYWDSVSLGALKKCPRYYQLAIIEGWRTKQPRVDLEFGILFHAALEHYDHRRAEGQTHEPALDSTIDWVMTATWDQKLNRPWQTGDSNKNRLTLVRSVIWYCDHYQNDTLVTVIKADKKPAVEVSFRFPLGFGPTGSLPYDAETDAGGESEEFWLCGHLDRLVRFAERTWIADRKTTRHTLDSYYFAGYSPDNQFSIYTLAGQVVLKEKIAGIIVDGCQILVEGTRFARALVERTEAQLSEFVRGLHTLLRQAEYYARHNFWPMNDRACFRCEFRSICSRAPSLREQWLKADFTKQTWDPTQARGDV